MKKIVLIQAFLLVILGGVFSQDDVVDANFRFSGITPNLIVYELEPTIQFYTEIIGFKVISSFPEEERNPEFAIMEKNGLKLMLQKVESFTRDIPVPEEVVPGGGGVLYINVKDVDVSFRAIQPHVGFYTEPMETFYGTREFTFRDLNGYYITLAQDLMGETDK